MLEFLPSFETRFEIEIDIGFRDSLFDCVEIFRDDRSGFRTTDSGRDLVQDFVEILSLEVHFAICCDFSAFSFFLCPSILSSASCRDVRPNDSSFLQTPI